MSDPKILLHPNIPKPLHGVAPRVIYGQAWWDVQRKLAYEKAGFCCEACGVPKRDAMFHKWLEAHEIYDIDYEHGKAVFVRLVALCHSCHNFIHSGRLGMLLKRGEISQSRHDYIRNHGLAIIREANLMSEYENRHSHDAIAEWENWKMVVDGKEYGPSSENYTQWVLGYWRGWKP